MCSFTTAYFSALQNLALDSMIAASPCSLPTTPVYPLPSFETTKPFLNGFETNYFKVEHKSIIKHSQFLVTTRKRKAKAKATIEYIPGRYGKWNQIQG